MKTSIIHPSRGRSRQAMRTALKFLQTSCSKVDEYILSLDNDDNIAAYQKEFDIVRGLVDLVITASNNRNVVDAMNAGAARTHGDLLVCISDDFEPSDCWLSRIELCIDVNQKQALMINDSYAHRDDIILTLPIITRPLYGELGYVYYPEYTGMFADNDLAELCMARGYLVRASHIEIKHNHFTRKLNPFDATYKRHNNKESWDLGKRIIHERRLNNFK